MPKEKNELKQTKNSFKAIGKVTRIDKDGAFREDQATKGKRKDDTYRALRFGIKTSETNEVTVNMFDFEPEKVFMWNSEKKKADKNYKGDRVDFEDWFDNQDRYREEGYAVLQTRVGLTYGEDGKIKSHGLPSFVASQVIHDGLDNDDSVVVEGEIRYSSYENQEGKTVEKKDLTIKKVFKIKDVDFNAENFEEISFFEQEMVFVDAVAEKKEKKVFVTGRVIDYNQNFQDVEFVVNYSDGTEDGVDEGMVKLADAFLKKFKFGDVFNAFGKIENRVIVEEVEEEASEEEDLLSQLGGKAKPKHAQTYQNKSYVSEMQIEGVDAWDKKVYREEDFVVEQVVEDKTEESKNKLSDELGGKKKNDKNPFELDEGEEPAISEDDLPF